MTPDLGIMMTSAMSSQIVEKLWSGVDNKPLVHTGSNVVQQPGVVHPMQHHARVQPFIATSHEI